MIRIVLTSLFLLLAIIFGVYPYVENSPLNKFLSIINIEFQFTSIHHMVLGTILFIIGISISQTKSISEYWF